MNTLLNLVKKELRELLTPATLASVIVVMIVFISLGSFIGAEVEQQTSLQPLGYFDDTPQGSEDLTYSQFAIESLKNYYAETYEVDPEKYVINLSDEISSFSTDELCRVMGEKNLTSAFYFPKDFNDRIDNFIIDGQKASIEVYYNQVSAGLLSVVNEVSTTQGLSLVNTYVSAKLIEKFACEQVPAEAFVEVMSPTNISMSTFFNGKLHEGITPDQISSAVNQMTTFVPIIIMIIIVMIGSIVISSIGNEKENKTMETLLTLPVKRTTIVTGKLLGAAIAGLVMGIFYMIGMYFYINGMQITINKTVTLEDLGLTLSVMDWVIVVAMMFLAILCALGMCMILGALAKNYKAAQMYVMPISVLAIIPMFVTMFTDVSQLPEAIKAIMYIIPFTHPMTVMQNLMFDNTAIVMGGLIYLAIFTVAMILITVKMYNSDILITGLVKKKEFKRRSLFRN